MMIQPISLLAHCQGPTAYRVTEVQRSSYEAFFIRRDLETVRTTDTTDVTVTVYVDHGEYTGDASFSVYARTTEQEFLALVENACRRARLINNPRYTLPADQTLQEVIPSGFDGVPMSELCADIAKAAMAADHYEGSSINALEIFLYRTRTRVVNSCGIDKTEIKHHAMIEAIPTCTVGEESVELYEQYVFGEPDLADITAEIDRKMQQVVNRARATKPDVPPVCRVVLPAPELSELVFRLVSQLDYAAVHSHANAFSKGDVLQADATGDLLSVTMRGKVPGCCGGAAFDGDGVTLIDTDVIRDGKVVSYFGSNRYAQYLGEPVTGQLPILTMACGSLSDAELAQAPYFLCVSMSGLQLDVYNDYIGGEVRLAYYVDGDTVTPMTGISLNGKLSCALRSMRLADTPATRRSYHGPALAAFDTIAIV